MNLKIPSWWRDVFFLFLWFFCWSRSMNVRVMDTWDLEKKGVIHHSSCFSLSQMPTVMYSKWLPGLPSRLGDLTLPPGFSLGELHSEKTLQKTKISRFLRALLSQWFSQLSQVGYIEKTLEKKHFAPEKMLGDDPFLLAETLKKAVSFRDAGYTSWRWRSRGGGGGFSKMTWNLYVRNMFVEKIPIDTTPEYCLWGLFFFGGGWKQRSLQ